MKVLLYTTLGCHLCEQAHAQLLHLQQQYPDRGSQIEIETVEIADDDALMNQYGIRIPVIRVHESEIGWPFTIEELGAFLSQVNR